MEIENDPLLQEYLNARCLKSETKKDYIKRLKVYCEFNSMTPTELIEEAEDEEETIPRMRRRSISQRLKNFRKYMENKEPAHSISYIKDRMVITKAFYKHFDIILPNISNTSEPIVREYQSTDDIPSLKDIELLVEKASIKYKGLILLGVSSGMGGAELRHLTIGDYFKAHNIPFRKDTNVLETLEQVDESNIPTWQIIRHRTSMPYYTFSSPETNKAINRHLKNVARLLTVETPIFATPNGVVMRDTTLSVYCKTLNDRCGFGKKGKQRFFHTHVMRKVFKSIVVNNEMDMIDSEWLIGHRIPMMADIYTKPSIARLKNEYLKVLPHLSLTPIDTVTIESKEYKELKERYVIDSNAKDKRISKLENIVEKYSEVFEDNELLERIIKLKQSSAK